MSTPSKFTPGNSVRHLVNTNNHDDDDDGSEHVQYDLSINDDSATHYERNHVDHTNRQNDNDDIFSSWNMVDPRAENNNYHSDDETITFSIQQAINDDDDDDDDDAIEEGMPLISTETRENRNNNTASTTAGYALYSFFGGRTNRNSQDNAIMPNRQEQQQTVNPSLPTNATIATTRSQSISQQQQQQLPDRTSNANDIDENDIPTNNSLQSIQSNYQKDDDFDYLKGGPNNMSDETTNNNVRMGMYGGVGVGAIGAALVASKYVKKTIDEQDDVDENDKAAVIIHHNNSNAPQQQQQQIQQLQQQLQQHPSITPNTTPQHGNIPNIPTTSNSIPPPQPPQFIPPPQTPRFIPSPQTPQLASV
jgi:hypothetical protein